VGANKLKILKGMTKMRFGEGEGVVGCFPGNINIAYLLHHPTFQRLWNAHHEFPRQQSLLKMNQLF
jgi:hypothetical protein